VGTAARRRSRERASFGDRHPHGARGRCANQRPGHPRALRGSGRAGAWRVVEGSGRMSEVKRCTKCREVKPLEEYPPRKDARDGRHSWCHACRAKRTREARWAKQGIPPEKWQRLHAEADRKAEARAARRNSVPDGFKRCSRCDEAKPLEEFPPHADTRDGRGSWCRVCYTKRDRETTWSKKGIPESDWPRLHREADRQQRMRDRKSVV